MDTGPRTRVSFKGLSSQPCWGKAGRTTSPKPSSLIPAHCLPFLSGTEKGRVPTGPCGFCEPEGTLGPRALWVPCVDPSVPPKKCSLGYKGHSQGCLGRKAQNQESSLVAPPAENPDRMCEAIVYSQPMCGPGTRVNHSERKGIQW